MERIVLLLKKLNANHGAKLDRWWLGYLVCVVGFGVTVLAFYPGYMSPDSIANLTSGRQGYYYDINSPLMSWLWGVFDRVFPGPAPMLIFHNLIFWSGCGVFWRTAARRSSKLGICLVLIGFMPQVLSQLSPIWKDIGLGVSLFFASSVLYCSANKRSRSALLITPFFLFYAFAARLNSFPAILPLAIWTGVIFCDVFDLKLAGLKKAFFVAAFGALYFFALTAAVGYVNAHLTEGRTVYPFQQVFLYDLAAISKDLDEPLFPEYVLNGGNFSLENVKAEYNVRSVNTLIYGDRPSAGDPPILKLSTDPNEITALESKWKQVVWAHKSAYLRHRFFVFAQLVGFTRLTVTHPYWDPGFRDNPAEFRPEPNLLNKTLTKYFRLFRKWVFFRGFFWIALSLWLMLCAVRNRFREDWQTVFFLSLSSVLFALAYFPTTPSTEFRYIFWSELSSAAGAVFAAHIVISRKLVSTAD